MKLLAYASFSRPQMARITPVLSRCASPSTVTRKGLSARFVLVEDLDYLYRTGKSRQVLRLCWTRS